jgi:predicted nuclease of predicted toxin-antitoxin system
VARVYLDEDVSVLLAQLLQAREIDTLTARDAGMLGKSDKEHLRKASELQRILVTHNRSDFEELYSIFLQEDLRHSGIIVLTRKRDVYLSASRLTNFLYHHSSLNDQLWYL